MAISVQVPKLGNSVEECIVARWCKRQGETVSAGDVVAEIETDKATFEVTAPVNGTVLAIFSEEGALVPVFTNLFVIGEPGEAFEGPAAAPSSEPTAGSTAAPAAAPTEEPEALPRPTSTSTHGGRWSPRARRFSEEHDFHPPQVNGSGPDGRVLESDLRALHDSSTLISSIREKIARRMRESLASTAQYTMHSSASAEGLRRIRTRLPREININHLVTFCAIETLLEVPALNAEFRDGRIVPHAEVHIGFACDTPRGLLVPVVHHAGDLCIDELAARMRDLAAQAIAGSIAPDDLMGATFTISNLGNLGVEAFTPLLNPPQVAILGVGAIQLKAVRVDGRIEFEDRIGLSLTCDHQVIDGAPGARFLQVLQANLENVESLCAMC